VLRLRTATNSKAPAAIDNAICISNVNSPGTRRGNGRAYDGALTLKGFRSLEVNRSNKAAARLTVLNSVLATPAFP